MRLRNVKNKDSILENSEYYITNPYELKGKWNKAFNNNNPIMLEIGMGKGDFIINMARKYPEYNFIGIEKYESVLVRAIKKLNESGLNNVKVVAIDASKSSDILDREIDTLYLNFSDPWPKKRHYKRRLTYKDYLMVYDLLFKGDAKIKMKTDNDQLFESSLIELNNYGYEFLEIKLDLWNSDIDNIRTEYENKFGSMGFKIKYLNAIKKDSSK